MLRKQLGQMFSMPLDDVRCIFMEGAGCYGRNGHEDAAADAALLAKAVGKPVRVQWSRADEHGWDPKGPPTLIDLRAGIDSSGNVAAWMGEFFWIRSPGRMQNTFANECFIDELAAVAKTDPVEFRLKHLEDARGIELLKRAAALAKWDTRVSPKPRQSGDVALP